jgi:hypothetical protein
MDLVLATMQEAELGDEALVSAALGEHEQEGVDFARLVETAVDSQTHAAVSGGADEHGERRYFLPSILPSVEITPHLEADEREEEERGKRESDVGL